jgi:copper resistance protein C
MKRLAIAVALAATLAVPAAAQAGGWATVTLAPPPAGLQAEETWTAQLTVLRHGQTPTDGAAPAITIRGPDGPQTFKAKPAGATGAYVAQVVFPSAGSWRYEVSDGLTATGYGHSQTHTYAAVDITPGTGGGGGVPAWPFALAAVALVAGAAVVLVRQRGRRPATQS